MKPLLFILIITTPFFGCDEKSFNITNNDKYVSDTLLIGNGLKLETPFKVEYNLLGKGSLDEGRILHDAKILYTFRLNFNLVDDTIKSGKLILSDTVSTSLRKDTLIFNWYREDELDWITIKHIYSHASGIHSQYSIHGYSKLGKSKQEELSYLFSEMRRTELVNFFESDSVLIKNIVELK